MDRDTKVILGAVLFFAGMILRSTDILDIIHEYMHVAFSATDGHKAIKITQSRTTFEELKPIIIYSGYYGEAMLYGGITFILMFIFKPLAMFFFGILHMVAYSAYYSSDFNSAAMAYFNNRSIVEANLNRWVVLMAIGLIVLWAICCGGSLSRKTSHTSEVVGSTPARRKETSSTT